MSSTAPSQRHHGSTSNLRLSTEKSRSRGRWPCYRAIQDAKLAGQDDMFQNDVAARTVRWIRPEMTASEALTVVKSVRHKRLHDT
jgi:hypothetical protein